MTLEGPVRNYTVLLRAVAHDVSGADILYTGKHMLSDGRNDAARVYNLAVADMVAALLDLRPNPEVVEQVLRSLPDQ